MRHGFAWVREHGTLHVPDVREQSDFPLGAFSMMAHLLGCSPSPARRTQLER